MYARGMSHINSVAGETTVSLSHYIDTSPHLVLPYFPHLENHLAWILLLPKHLQVVKNNIIST